MNFIDDFNRRTGRIDIYALGVLLLRLSRLCDVQLSETQRPLLSYSQAKIDRRFRSF